MGKIGGFDKYVLGIIFTTYEVPLVPGSPCLTKAKLVLATNVMKRITPEIKPEGANTNEN